MDKKDVLVKVIKNFLEKAVDDIKDLETSIKQEDFENIRTKAHSIKGSAGTLEALDFYKKSKALEDFV